MNSPSYEANLLVNDQKEFKRQIQNLKCLEIYPRLDSWVEFFNQYYSDFFLSYSNTIFALLDFAQFNQLFKEQTKHEQKLSIRFFKQVFKYSPHFEIDGIESAKYFISMSLIYGRYSGMVIGSPVKELKNLNHLVTKKDAEKIFENLFVKFENPSLLTERLHLLGLSELDLLMHILQGNNPRVFEKLPIPLSRKESFFFTHASIPELDLKNDLLVKTIITSKLLAAHNDSSLLSRFLKPNHFFNFRIDEFYKNISFWKSAFYFISKIDWLETHLYLNEFVDYFMFKRHNEDLNYSLKSRTLGSVTRAIENWHQYGDYQNIEDLLTANWGKPRKSTTVFENEVYEFHEITSGKRLFEESEKMNHCAFSYIEMCRDGITSVWSISRKKDNKLKSILTIELQGKTVTQVVRKNNQEPSALETELVRQWAEEKQYMLHTSIGLAE